MNEDARVVEALVGMAAEIIALCLDQVRASTGRRERVEPGERCGEAGYGKTDPHRLDDDVSPARPSLRKLRTKIGREHERADATLAGGLAKSLADTIQETRADDAARLPDARHLGQVGAVVACDACGLEQLETLGQRRAAFEQLFGLFKV